MNDLDTIEQLSAYLDGELTEGEITELEHRLARDPSLQSELDAMRSAVDLLRTHGPVQAPPALYGDILRAVENEPMPGGFWAWLQRPFGLPLPAVALGGVAVLVVGVAVTGTVVVNQPGALRPAMVDFSASESRKGETVAKADGSDDAWDGSEKAEKPAAKDVRENANDAVADVDLSQRQGAAAGEEIGEPEPAASKGKVAMKEIDSDGLLDKKSAGTTSSSARTSSSAGSASSGTTNSGTYGDGMLYSGKPKVQIGLRPDDLERVAELYMRYAGSSKRTQSTASTMAAWSDGRHDITLDLPDIAARNAFEQDLRRMFPGTYKSATSDDGTLTMDNTRLQLTVVVTDIAQPATGGTKDGAPIQTLRSKSYEADEMSAPEEPESTGTEE